MPQVARTWNSVKQSVYHNNTSCNTLGTTLRKRTLEKAPGTNLSVRNAQTSTRKENSSCFEVYRKSQFIKWAVPIFSETKTVRNT